MLQGFGLPLQQMMVNAGAHTINTIIAGQGTPLVMLHGFAAGIGLWTHNIKEFAQHHTVYAIDLPGFGRSSRTPFTGTTAQEAEDYFVEALESWRKEMGLEKFVLLGHSFGGYISGCYSLRYPQHVDHLILADSWGLSQMPEKGGLSDIPSWKRAARKVFLLMTPISALQYAGPCGPKLIEAFRRDLANKFSNFYESVSVVSDYLYHMNVQHPSGATAFACLHISLRWSKTPLCQRIHALDSNIPVTLVFGSDTWIDREAGSRLGHNYGRNIPCHVISNSGHHIYADNPVEFNQVILGASKSVQQVHLGPEQSCILQEAHL
jgi:pimeloyl-ACP methyl ester carboxylesterase